MTLRSTQQAKEGRIELKVDPQGSITGQEVGLEVDPRGRLDPGVSLRVGHPGQEGGRAT